MQADNKQKVVLIFGPTASGKTDLAIQIAKKFNGEIINADSRQFYKDMPIITAMPSKDEFAQATHHLFEILDPGVDFSVADYLKLATQKVDEINSKGKLAIIVGGTGLYLKALEFGLSPIPSVDKAIFDRFNDLDAEVLYKQLQEKDVVMAERLEANDRQRVIRALSVLEQTGKSLADWQEMPNEDAINADFIHLAIAPEREVLYSRINSRAAKMLDMGLIEEISILNNTYKDNRVNSLTSIGFDIFADYFNQKLSLDDAISLFAQKQRNYAKRQLTWLNNQYKAEFIHTSLDETLNYVSNRLK